MKALPFDYKWNVRKIGEDARMMSQMMYEWL